MAIPGTQSGNRSSAVDNLAHLGKASCCLHPREKLWIKCTIQRVEGTWAVWLKPGQHVHVPAMHIYGWTKQVSSVALLTLSVEGASHRCDRHGLLHWEHEDVATYRCELRVATASSTDAASFTRTLTRGVGIPVCMTLGNTNCCNSAVGCFCDSTEAAHGAVQGGPHV